MTNTVPADGSVLPFPSTESASTAGFTLAESTHQRRVENPRLPADAPNILIVLLDDVGFGLSDVVGGEVSTPAFRRVAEQGLAYNTFHTTSICSPTRAALLTGRNHHRVHSGTIAERAVDWDGYTGVIGKDTATVAEVLQHYGYTTAAFGKWHNSPATETTAMGPFDRWPTGHGFDYFYGFIAGETSQWEPRLYENLNPIEPPHDENYHLSEDLADRAISWLGRHESFAPDRPFLMYWAPGAAHGPHHIFGEWADKYAGRFDTGWDDYRERVFARQKERGWIPATAQLTPRADSMQGWAEVPEAQRPFQRRLMEVFAGFVEHVDVQVGRILDEMDRLGKTENTIVFYIFGDNGSSAEGQKGSISELLAQNNIPVTVEEQLAALERLGGLTALGTPKTDNMYHAGWAWAGNTPFHHTKLVASHFGGTRNPMAVSWPRRITPDGAMRTQFHHVNDIVPTLYEILGIPHPTVVDGHEQKPMDGVSMAYTFDHPNQATRKTVQYFENSASRGIYSDGWFACAFGPFVPWDTPGTAQRLANWDADTEPWELYHLDEDFSQADDLAATHPGKLAELKALFKEVSRDNLVWPIGAGLWLRIHPEDRVASPYTKWRFDGTCTRMPEFTAPGLGRQDSHVVIALTVPESASGVVYSLGGFSGGVTLFLDAGVLVYEYNMLIIDRFQARSAVPVAPGAHVITVDTAFSSPQPMAPATVTLEVDGSEVATVVVARTVPAAFTASETFGVGVDLGSPVSPDYFDRRPFRFSGTIASVDVEVFPPGSRTPAVDGPSATGG
ncbi:arylsulfatase [Mycolicibacterium chlorophenolicum]|uniref:Arylsulfatase n=1 Tax=Mycolicibacterium chlorophenolicum TaxID=37916 RepID=A0A0J6WQ75_9MYCO|nr:arylsulfatase [Mycolicibacterium chlorophenolicum]KMO83877.1 Arylsulfatase [Mycolicibacterium chlorophenolicum]